MQKDFPGWHRHKEQLHAQHHTPTFQEREIWWCSVGVNVGHEMDGKNQFYNRPVLIVRKFNPHIFFGVPLTLSTSCDYLMSTQRQVEPSLVRRYGLVSLRAVRPKRSERGRN